MVRVAFSHYKMHYKMGLWPRTLTNKTGSSTFRFVVCDRMSCKHVTSHMCTFIKYGCKFTALWPNALHQVACLCWYICMWYCINNITPVPYQYRPAMWYPIHNVPVITLLHKVLISSHLEILDINTTLLNIIFACAIVFLFVLLCLQYFKVTLSISLTPWTNIS